MAEKMNKVKDKVTTVAKTAYDKTAYLAKIAKLKVEIQANKVKLNTVYKKLGKLYYTYKKTENISEEETSALVKEADVLTAKIAGLDKELFILQHPGA